MSNLTARDRLCMMMAAKIGPSQFWRVKDGEPGAMAVVRISRVEDGLVHYRRNAGCDATPLVVDVDEFLRCLEPVETELEHNGRCGARASWHSPCARFTDECDGVNHQDAAGQQWSAKR